MKPSLDTPPSRTEIELRERLRVAMNFIEEWSQWWSYALALDDDAMTEEQKAADEEKAARFGSRGARMVVENRHFLNTGDLPVSEMSPPAPSPLGGLADILAEYDAIVNRFDRADPEADFVMRGSDWREIRKALKNAAPPAGEDSTPPHTARAAAGAACSETQAYKSSEAPVTLKDLAKVAMKDFGPYVPPVVYDAKRGGFYDTKDGHRLTDAELATHRKQNPLNCDRDARRWAREFNEVLYQNHGLYADWLVSWFANAIMCGEDTYRWRKEAEASTPQSAIEAPKVEKLLADIEQGVLGAHGLDTEEMNTLRGALRQFALAPTDTDVCKVCGLFKRGPNVSGDACPGHKEG